MKLVQGVYNWFERPHRLLAVRGALADPSPVILDVGCGNHSPSVTKRHLPHCVYHGLDRQEWNRDERDDACIDTFYDIDLEDPDGLHAVEDHTYNVVLCSHLLEHLSDPYSVVDRLATKVKRGGLLYVEVPSPRSAHLPRAANGWFGIKGCLNFHDDPSHRCMVSLPKVKTLLAERGFQVARVRNRFLWRRILFLPAYVLAGLVSRGYVPASVVWDVIGFAQYLVARPFPAGPPRQE